MARFYGSMQGNRGAATRMGTPASGIGAHVRGWDLGIAAEMEDSNGVDVAYVYATGGSNNPNTRTLLARVTRGDVGWIIEANKETPSNV